MRILIVNQYTGSELHGMVTRHYFLAKEWVALGHEVRIIGASYSHTRFMQPTLTKSEIELVNGVEFQWLKTPKYSGNSVARFTNIATFVLRLWMRSNSIIREFSPDIVISSSTHNCDIGISRKISAKSNAKLVYEIRDLWPRTLVELSNISKSHPVIKIIGLAEQYALKHADLVASVLPRAWKHAEELGIEVADYLFIPNGVSLDSVSGEQSSLSASFKRKISDVRKKGRPVVGYCGNIGKANALDFMLDVAKETQGEIEYILVGDGTERDRISNRLVRENINNVVMEGRIRQTEVQSFLELVDIAYIGWLDLPMYRYGISPNKFADYMLASKPILHVSRSTEDLVTESNCGVTVRQNLDLVKDAIVGLANIPLGERESMGQRGRDYIIENRGYRKLALDYINSLSKLRDLN